MKYCSKCGKELLDEAVICPNCGCFASPYGWKANRSGYVTAIKVLMIISTVINGLYLLPLLWCLPMTISYFNKIANNEEITVGFKVCSLLFVSPIAGILMLCEN